MITISDLNVSQESGLTELKNAEMGDIVGGNFVFTPARRLRLDFNIANNGTVTPTVNFRFGTLTLFSRLAAELTLNILP